MTGHRKALKIVSTLFIVGALVMVAGGCVMFASGYYLTADTAALEEVGASQNDAVSLIAYGVWLVVMGVFYCIIGILGRRGANNPRLIVPFLVASILGVLFGISDLFSYAYNGGLTFQLALDLLVGILLPGLCAYLAIMIRKNREGLEAGSVSGPDGDEYPDGYNPKKLGFMRVLQVFFALNIAFSIISLTTLIKGNYELDFAQMLNLLNLMFDGVLFWLIWQRSSVARYWAIGMTTFNIVIGTAVNLASGTFELGTQLSLCAFDILVLVYFITSRRAKAILVQPFSMERVEKQLAEEESTFFNPRKWSFWRSLLIYFCIFCVVGHWMEAGFCLFIKWGIIPGTYDPNSQIWSDWLYPFPVYGFGTVACILLLYPIKNWLQRHFNNNWAPLVVSFIINTLVCSAIELVLGLVQNQPVNGVYPLWDYSNMFCNLWGQICLQNSLAFGFVATLMTWVVYPGLEKLMIKLPNGMANVLFIVVVIFFSILMALYLINVPTDTTTTAPSLTTEASTDSGDSSGDSSSDNSDSTTTVDIGGASVSVETEPSS